MRIDPNERIFVLARKLFPFRRFWIFRFIKRWIIRFSFGLGPPKEHYFLKRFCVGIVIDVGANRGGYTRKFFQWGAKEIHAIEPNKRFANKLRRLGAIVYTCGAGSTPGHFVFHESEDDVTSSFRDGWCDSVRNYPVEVRSLDSLGIRGKIFLIKIDAERMDYEVLLGAEGILKRDHPAVLVECWDGERKKIVDYMRGLGYDEYLAIPSDNYLDLFFCRN